VNGGKVFEAIQRLSLMLEVAESSVLEEPPDLLAITEVPTRRHLARGAIATIIALEDLTLSVRCLPVCSSAHVPSGELR
jgi:hypothetical protein